MKHCKSKSINIPFFFDPYPPPQNEFYIKYTFHDPLSSGLFRHCLLKKLQCFHHTKTKYSVVHNPHVLHNTLIPEILWVNLKQGFLRYSPRTCGDVLKISEVSKSKLFTKY